MNNKNYQNFLKLTTRQTPDNASVLILLRDIDRLLTDTKNKTLLNNIHNKLMQMFFQHNSLTKKYVLKLLKRYKRKLTLIDPLIHKTDLISNLLSDDIDSCKYMLKYIKMNKEKFVNDLEIVAEVKFSHCRNKIFDVDVETEPYIDEQKYPENDIEKIVEYIEKYKNKYTVKLLIAYPVLCEFAPQVKVRDKHFLSLKEAQKLQYTFNIFEPEWNIGIYKKVEFKDAIRETNYSVLFNFLVKYIKNRNIKRCNLILKIFKSCNEMNLIYRLMFTYIYNIINDVRDDMNEYLCKFYAVFEMPDTRRLKKRVFHMFKL